MNKVIKPSEISNIFSAIDTGNANSPVKPSVEHSYKPSANTVTKPVTGLADMIRPVVDFAFTKKQQAALIKLDTKNPTVAGIIATAANRIMPELKRQAEGTPIVFDGSYAIPTPKVSNSELTPTDTQYKSNFSILRQR